MIVRRVLKLGGVCALLLIGASFVLISATVYTYNVLTREALVAELRFRQIGSQHYVATVSTDGTCDLAELEVYGDQWRIDAEFLKWKYWALLLGLDSQYRLDRFEGRYRSAAEQNVGVKLAHDLAPRNAFDLVAISRSLGRLNFLVDATYGSSTYQDIDTSRVFRVYSTPTGLLTRSEPKPTSAQPLVVEVTRACGTPGVWERFARWSDGIVAGLL